MKDNFIYESKFKNQRPTIAMIFIMSLLLICVVLIIINTIYSYPNFSLIDIIFLITLVVFTINIIFLPSSLIQDNISIKKKHIIIHTRNFFRYWKKKDIIIDVGKLYSFYQDRNSITFQSNNNKNIATFTINQEKYSIEIQSISKILKHIGIKESKKYFHPR